MLSPPLLYSYYEVSRCSSKNHSSLISTQRIRINLLLFLKIRQESQRALYLEAVLSLILRSWEHKYCSKHWLSRSILRLNVFIYFSMICFSCTSCKTNFLLFGVQVIVRYTQALWLVVQSLWLGKKNVQSPSNCKAYASSSAAWGEGASVLENRKNCTDFGKPPSSDIIGEERVNLQNSRRAGA